MATAPEPVRFSEGQNKARKILSGPNRYALLVGGARSGKTFLTIRAIIMRALSAPSSRHAVFRFHANAARASIAVDTLPTVMRKCFPGVGITEHRQDGYFELENESQIWIAGLDDKDRVEKILGQEFATLYFNESSQIPYSSYTVACTRLAQRIRLSDDEIERIAARWPDNVAWDPQNEYLKQRAFVDLNPVGKMHWTRRLFQDHVNPTSGKPLSNPEDYAIGFLNPIDNKHNLDPAFLKMLEDMPEKARKRFYEGVYVDEVDGALWNYTQLESCRVEPEAIPESKRAAVVVAVDPSGAKSADDTVRDEIGIVVAARGTDGHGYVLEDLSTRCSPHEWGLRAVLAFHRYRADCIIAEGNFGGAMVEATIKAADPNVPIRMVTASRGKAVRAEPISVLYAKGLVHHVGRMAVLEDQYCAFAPSGYQGHGSPDHADAAIWALTYLLGSTDGTSIIEAMRRMSQPRLTSPFGPVQHDMPKQLIPMLPPPGVSNVSGLSGNTYLVNSEGVVQVVEQDRIPLRNAGFREL